MPKMNLNDFPQEQVLLEDRYRATLKECTEYTKDYGEGPVSKIAWVFTVEASDDAVDTSVEYEGESTDVHEIAAHTSFATGPNSNFAKLNFPAFVGDNWSGDTDDLIGKSCIVDVTSYETKGGQTRNVIEKIRVPKATQKAGVAAQKTKKEIEAENAEEFNEIPF